MDQNKRTPEEDDGRVIADMSGVKRQPLIVPDVSNIRKVKEDRAAQAEQQSFNTGSPEILDKEGRRAMMGGVMSAMLLVGGLIFAAFAAVILIIGHLL